MKKVEIRFIGHSTVQVTVNNVSFITDPMLSEKVLMVKRAKPPGASIEELKACDCILISHAHFDHLDLPTLDGFNRDIPVITPRWVGKFARSLGFKNVIELAKWKSYSTDDFFVTAVPAKHFGERIYLDPWRRYLGYVFGVNNGPAIYFAGDTGYFKGIREIGNKFDIFCALLPIGAYRPAFSMEKVHLNPEQALKVFREINAEFMIPVHFGTFKLSLEPVEEPARLFSKLVEADKSLSDKVFILNEGESKVLNWTAGI